jgi:hypothetical protein
MLLLTMMMMMHYKKTNTPFLRRFFLLAKPPPLILPSVRVSVHLRPGPGSRMTLQPFLVDYTYCFWCPMTQNQEVTLDVSDV